VALLIILTCFGLGGGLIGRSKGSSFFIWFLISFCVPFIGIVCAILYRNERDELRRQCPGCGKVVMLHDALCTRCGTELEFPDVAIAPQSAGVRRVRSRA
jgi:hypothetical protein